MKHKIVTPKDEWVDNLDEYMKKFREENPYYPIDPFQRISEQHYEFMMDDNHRYQFLKKEMRMKEMLEHGELAPF